MAPQLLAAIIPMAFQAIKAIKDSKQAGSLEDVERPVRQVPDAIEEMIKRLRINSTQTKAPGADIMENNLLSAGAAGVSDIKEFASSPSSAISAVSSLYGNVMGGMNDLSIRNQEYSQEMIQQLLSGLPQLANEQDKNFEYNENDPYQTAKRAEAAFRYSAANNGFNAASGASNIFGALGNIPS